MLLDLVSGPTSSEPTEFALVGGEVFFGARDGVGGTELWKTDGTTLGTVLVTSVASGGNATRPTDIVDLQGIAIFTVTTTMVRSLMRSDGTPGGTSTIAEFNSTPMNLRAIGASVYFGGATGSTGFEPWISDGFPSGTELLKDIVPGGGISSTEPREFTGLGNQVLFVARLGFGADHELWRTEGTEITTERVLEINPGFADEVSDLRAIGGLVYFAANNGSNGIELWQSDGTADGTVQTVDLLSTGGSFPRELTVFDGRLFFVATSDASGREVFMLAPHSVPALLPAMWGVLVVLLGALGLTSLRRFRF
jgi:ELWxxDGT repeat protein